MAEQKREQLYLPADFYLVRAPALPAQVFTHLSNAGHVDIETMLVDETLQERKHACAAALLQLAARPEVTLALALASPSLMEGSERLWRGEMNNARQARITSSLLRYLIRMTTRPTPFGLFAGIGWGHFAARTDLCLGKTAIQRFRTRPDMHWLLAFIQQMEEDSALVTQLRVQLNQTAYLAGERAILPFADTYGVQDTCAISLRATAVVRKVFALTHQFIAYTELQAALQQAFPHATAEQVQRVLWQLWEHGFLVSELHPPLTEAHPTEYVLARLDTCDSVDERKVQLTRVLAGVSALDSAGIGAPVSLVATLLLDQRRFVPGANEALLPLQVDSALQVQAPRLHQSIGSAAAQAASFLLRTTPLPAGPRHLQEYRLLFLETYGEQAEVPLLDLLSPENGLDAPAEYQNPPRTYERPTSLPDPEVNQRYQLLLRLVTEAVNRRSLEVELTEEIQQHLERWPLNREKAPLSLEIYLQIHAESRAAIDRGEWTAVVGRNCGSPGAGRTFGRFFDLLDEPTMEHLRTLAAREEAQQPDVIFAELSYQPRQARLANVAIRPSLRSYEIAVGTTPSLPPERVLTLSDLVVGIQHGHFYLRSRRLGKQVRVCQSHMLNASLAPNICRFLLESADDGLPVLSVFDWGGLASAPFLPRLTMKMGPSATLVITPARWQLRAETIPLVGEGSAETRWFRGLQHWREQWRVPRYVYLTQGDNRLLLDLENPLMAAELRNSLKKLTGNTQLMLDELLPDLDHLWLLDTQDSHYFAEVVVPLLRSNAPLHNTEIAHRSRTIIPTVERKRFPGEDWIYLKLYAALSQHEALLAGPLHDIVRLLQELKLLDGWFFIRYADPEPHVRLRFHAKEGIDALDILRHILPWGTQLARRGHLQRYTLDTYEREVERYGGPATIDLLEQVFMEDSALVSDIIACQYDRRLTLDPLAVAVFTLDHFCASWGYDFPQRLAWTRQASEPYAWSAAFRPERERYCNLILRREQADCNPDEQRMLLLNLIHPHEAFLCEASAHVRQLAAAGQFQVTEHALLSSLMHMHVNRLLGIDRMKENQVYAFWRHTLDSLEHRPGQDHMEEKRKDLI